MNVISPSRNPHNVTRDFLPAIYETLCYFNATTFIGSDSEHYNCWKKVLKVRPLYFVNKDYFSFSWKASNKNIFSFRAKTCELI